MRSPARHVVATWTCGALAVMLASCGTREADSLFDPDNLGTVSVAVLPAGLTPGWTLDGPSGLHFAGRGTSTVSSLPAGSYTATWGALGGYSAPLPSTDNLEAGQTLTLTGVYTPVPPGTIHLTCNVAAGPWRLEWDGGAGLLTGAGSQTLASRPAGDYQVFWLPLDGYTTPSPVTQVFTLAPGGESTVTGIWTALPPGTVAIDPTPDVLNAPWTLLGPTSFQRTGSGNLVIPSLPTGDYALQWGAVSGWTSPQPSLVTGTLTANGTLTFRGTYTTLTRIGLFATSDGTSRSSSTTWTATNDAWAYIVIVDPDPSGVAYWDLKVEFTGANTVANDCLVISGTDAVPYLDTFRVTSPAALLPNAQNTVYVGAVRFYCGLRSATSVYLAPVSLIGYAPATPMYAPGSSPGTPMPLQPYNGSWGSPAFTIGP